MGAVADTNDRAARKAWNGRIMGPFDGGTGQGSAGQESGGRFERGDVDRHDTTYPATGSRACRTARADFDFDYPPTRGSEA
jgi:hypothetical protein